MGPDCPNPGGGGIFPGKPFLASTPHLSNGSAVLAEVGRGGSERCLVIVIKIMEMVIIANTY